MNTFFIILIALFVFGLLITVHEFGHFITAKLAGVTIHEFSIGMGPSIANVTKGGTMYSLRLFPIGGYVRMEGEDEDSNDQNAFCNKKVWQKILVVIDGAVFNVILGFILIIIVTSIQPKLSTTVVGEFNQGATSIEQLMLNDEILKINGTKINLVNDILFEFMRDEDGLVDIEVMRDNQKLMLNAVPFETYMTDGVQMLRLDFKVYGKDKTIGGVIAESYYTTASVVRQVWVSFGDLITGKFGFNQLSGPIGVTGAIGDVVNDAIEVAKERDSWQALLSPLFMVAYITINLGVFNLMPLPALDGGRLIFLLIEAVRGKPVPAKYEGFVHAAGFFLLIGLMIVVTYQDILKIFTR